MPMRTHNYMLLHLLAAASLLMVGCSERFPIKHSGEFVEFGAASHQSILTRTAYGSLNDEGTHQDINWVSTDKIRIYSPTSARRIEVEQGITDPDQLYYWADYQVVPKEDDLTRGGLTRVGNDGLAWTGDQETTTFYSVYPLNRINSGIPEDEGKGLSPAGVNGVFPLTIPDRQNFSERGNLAEYGFMTATSTVSKEVPVELDFYPAFTAFEISIRSAGEAVGLSEFKLISGAEPLAGDYTVKYNAAGDQTFICPSASSTDGKEIIVNLSGKDAPAASSNTDLVFTVFAMPQDFTNLSVSFKTSQGFTRTLPLKYSNTATQHVPGSFVTFGAAQKHRIYGLVLPSGELLISVGTAPWLEGGQHTYTTIEDASTVFESYEAYLNDKPLWEDTYVAIAYGYQTIVVDEEEVTSPMYSPGFTLTTVSVGVPLKLISDNPNVGFYTTQGGVATELTIPASVVTTEKPYGTEVITNYFVVPLDDAHTGEVAHISLIRTDSNTPIAYTHQDLPGSTDHTKVLFMVLTPEDYQTKTEHITL